MMFTSVSRMLQIGALVLSLIFLFNSVQSDTCGKRTILRRPLVNFGERSYAGQWPWHAALFHRFNGSFSQYACGGAIVSSSYVITAAHCTYPRSKVRPLTISEMLVRVGITNIQGAEHSLQQQTITKIERHEDYLSGSVESDIALLKLAGELEITDFVRSVCLWVGSDAEDLIVGKDGSVAGWGRDETNRLPDLLKHAVMPIVSRKTCRDSDPKYYLSYLFDRKTFCAGYRNGTSANAGDSGGGLFIEVNGTWMLRGIVSNGKLTASRAVDTSSFIVFTDVAYFIKWIRTKMDLSIDNVVESDDKYAACGNQLRPSFVRNRYKQFRMYPWYGWINTVINPSDLLFFVLIINEFYVLAYSGKITEQYIRNPSELQLVFHRDNYEILSTHRIETILRHDNFTRSRMNNIALLELTDKLTFNYFLQPICIGNFGEALLRNNVVECESSIRATNPHVYCYQEKDVTLKGFDFYVTNEKFFLCGVLFDKVYDNEKSANIWVIANISYHINWIERKSKQPTKLHSLEECPEKISESVIVRVEGNITLQPLLCYGAMITRSLVVTTAVCVTGVPLESLTIIHEAEERNNLKAAYIHPYFESLTFTNNVAIVELAEPYLNDGPFCFPKYVENLSNIGLMLLGDVTITDTKQCAEKWRHKGVHVQIDGSQFCGKFNTTILKSENYCTWNNHGFPTFYQYPGSRSLYLRGILDIQKRDHCIEDGFSEVFIDLMFYADWIREIAAISDGMEPA